MALPGLVAAKNLSDVENREKVWDNIGDGITTTLPVGGSGISVELYAGTNFERLKAVSMEPALNFTEAYDIQYGGTGTNFSIKASGQVQAGQTGNNTFAVLPDDGIRIWFNGQKVVDAWITQGGTWYPFTVSGLVAGQWYDIYFEHFQGVGPSTLIFASGINGPIVTALRSIEPRTISFPIFGNDIFALNGVKNTSTKDFVRIKGLTAPAQPRLNTAAANTASGVARQLIAMPRIAPVTSGNYIFSGTTVLSGATLAINGANASSIATSPFSGSTAIAPIALSSISLQSNFRITEAMTSGVLANPEIAIPYETNEFVFFIKAGQG